MIKNSNNIVFICTFSSGSHHETLNSALLYICTQLSKHVKVHGRKNYIDNILSIIDNPISSTLSFFFVKNLNLKSKIGLLVNYFYDAILHIKILLTAGNEDIILCTCNNPFVLPFLNILNSKSQILIICHHELELLDKTKFKQGFLAKSLAFFTKSFFLNDKNHINNNIKFVVLGDSILNNLEQKLPKHIFNHFSSIEHPYIYKSCIYKLPSVISKIGTIGHLSDYKGASSYINFVKTLRKDLRQKCDFYVVGNLVYDENIFQKENIIVLKNTELKTKEEFQRNIKNLDLVLFFYPQSSYKFMASGAIFDVIDNEVPVLCLQNDYFKYLFEKLGSFGYLCKDIPQMQEVLYNIIDKPEEFNFKHIKKIASVDFSVVAFSNLINP